MIDRKYFKLDLSKYYRDLSVALVAFAAGFAWCLQADGLAFAVAFFIAAA